MEDVVIYGALIRRTGKVPAGSITTDKFNDSVFATNADINNRYSSATVRKIIDVKNLDYAVRAIRPASTDSVGNPLIVNTIYALENPTSGLDITLPSGAIGDFIQVDFISSGTTPPTITVTSPYGISDWDLTPEVGKTYSLYFDFGLLRQQTASDPGYGWRVGYSEYTSTPAEV